MKAQKHACCCVNFPFIEPPHYIIIVKGLLTNCCWWRSIEVSLSCWWLQEADENGSDGLDIEEFRAAFGQILGKGKNDQQMAILFMKIDTNCDGTVDWVSHARVHTWISSPSCGVLACYPGQVSVAVG